MNKTFKNIRESISSSQLKRLKKEYEPMRKIDMSKHKGQVEKTTAQLKKLKIGTLIDLYKENIPWISDIAKSLVKKDKRFAHHVESLDEGVNIKALAKQFRKNEDENRHSENYLMLAKAFGTSREVKEVEAIIRRNKIQGHTDPKDNKWMFNNIGKYFQKIGESVEESIIMGLNKSSAEYKAGKEAAKKGIKYDANPHAPGVKRLNWSTGHNDFRADALRKAGKPNYGARGQFEEVQLDEVVGPFQQVSKLLIKYGNNPKEVKRMMTKHMPYVTKKYPNASPAKVAEIISSLSATEELEEGKVFNKDRGIFKALLNLSKKKEYKKVSKAFVNLTTPSPIAKDKEIAKSLSKRLKQLADKLDKKEKAHVLKMADLASTYER